MKNPTLACRSSFCSGFASPRYRRLGEKDRIIVIIVILAIIILIISIILTNNNDTTTTTTNNNNNKNNNDNKPGTTGGTPAPTPEVHQSLSNLNT